METYKWSKMSGKLEGIPALNTDTTSNKFCQAMSKRKDTICSVCYSWSMLKTFRKNAVPRFKSNSDYLSYKIHDYDDVVEKISPKSVPCGIEEFTFPIGFDAPLDENGDWMKNPPKLDR